MRQEFTRKLEDIVTPSETDSVDELGIEEIPVAQIDDSVPDADMDNILEIVAEGGEELLTEEEYEEYSIYKNEKYSSSDPDDHMANLAKHVDEIDNSYLNSLGNDVKEWVDNDLNSRKVWMDLEVRGIRLLGVSSEQIGGGSFKGAAKVTHPLLMEACTQFQARAIAESWPSEGPVNTVVVGEITDEKEQQATRVKNFMNFQYMKLMPGAFEEQDKMLFRLPISGSCFKKTFYDPMEDMVVSRFIESSEMIVPYAATSLETAVRYTEKFEETANQTLKKMAAGVYRAVPIKTTDYGNNENTIVEDEIDDTEGKEFVQYDGDHPYTRYECNCELDLPGFEDVNEDGKITGISLPYVVTVDYENEDVLSIRRGWKEFDRKKKRRVCYTHYRFLPGLGFYGFGLVHAIGGLAEAATGALRSLLDAAGFANAKGGYRTRDARIPGGEKPVGMGEWIEVDTTADELKSAFFALPYDEPSKTMYELLGTLDDLGRRFASTTEAMVGEATNNGPVGTTLALIEQGSKVSSAIHKRNHASSAKEYNLLAELNGETLPDDYPYSVPGEDLYVLSKDFDDRVDVIPVSDPNTISDTQRISRAQGVKQLSSESPEMYDKRAVDKSMMRAMRVPNIDELMPEDESPPPMDAVTESALMIKGEPVMAYVDQDHEAHIAVHQAIFNTLGEDEQEVMGGQHFAHIAEHKAFDVKLHFEELIGAEITPENMHEATQAAAQVAQIYESEKAGSEEDIRSTEEKNKNAETIAGIKRKDTESSAKIKRDDDESAAGIEREAGREVLDAIKESTQALGIDKK